MTNSEEAAERAGYATLTKDQREAMERFQAAGERARRITAHGEELVAALKGCHELLDAIMAGHALDAVIVVEDARCRRLIGLIEGAS